MHRQGGVQCAVLYLPPPGTTANVVLDGLTLEPGADAIARNPVDATVIYPQFPNNPAEVLRFEHNYAAFAVDQQGRQYRQMFPNMVRRDIHTEQLALELVLQPMLNHYHETHDRDPQEIYLYSYFLPCPNCVVIIQRVIEQNRLRNIPLRVGFSDTPENIAGGRIVEDYDTAQARRDRLNNILNDHRGSLTDLHNYFGQCPSSHNRQGRSINENIAQDKNILNRLPRASDKRYEGQLKVIMDVSTGKAMVWYYIPKLLYGERRLLHIGLYGGDQRKTYQYVGEKEEGVINFNYDAFKGMVAKLQRGTRSWFWVAAKATDPVLKQSNKWIDQQYSWQLVNNLPDNYGSVYMIMTVMSNGYPQVKLAFCTKSFHYGKSDYITLQSYNGSEDNEHQELYVSSMKPIPGYDNILIGTMPYRLGNAYASGFRAKYVRYNRNRGWGWWRKHYEYGKYYDNVTPFSMPNECTDKTECDPISSKPMGWDDNPCECPPYWFNI